MRTVSIGCGSAGAADRLDGAVEVVEHGEVDYVCFDTLSEMTLKRNVLDRETSADLGYDPHLVDRFRALLPAAARTGATLVGNFGGINPLAAARRTAQIARELGLDDLRIGVVTGDDVTDWARAQDETVVVAQVYIGAFPVAEALAQGADVVVTGRVADSALYLGPLVYEFGWQEDDFDRLGAGTVIGHLLECGSLATGALWTDGIDRPVPGLARIGLPIADVSEDLSVVLRKPPGTGGVVCRANFAAQLMHEIDDPGEYLVPDVTANLLTVTLDQAGDDAVRVGWLEGPRGFKRPDRLKALVARRHGWLGEVLVFLPGPNARARARLIEATARERFEDVLDLPLRCLRFDHLGATSYRPTAADADVDDDIGDVGDDFMVLRIAAVAEDRAVAEAVARFGEYVAVVGPVGMGEHRQRVAPLFGIDSMLIDRSFIEVDVRVESARESARVGWPA